MVTIVEGIRYILPALVKGIRLLEMFTHHHQEWGLSELTRAFKLPRSTFYRLAPDRYPHHGKFLRSNPKGEHQTLFLLKCPTG